MFAVFGRAVRPDGRPVANALVQSNRGIAETDEHGYFQIDVAGADILSFRKGEQGGCQVAISAPRGAADLLSLGKVMCR